MRYWLNVVMLNDNMEQWIIAQAGGRQLRTVHVEERKLTPAKSSFSTSSRVRDRSRRERRDRERDKEREAHV
ncbi:unnamed protein product [Protopolystoma xenopodis]|uniref:Uncharacterized protein n=1 Tax=Protopolystoma xenopodis TaxID=117903 RepID=A0A448XE14_9PLAT|nr:unnamed protein product [Protopolystoma xenopodis]